MQRHRRNPSSRWLKGDSQLSGHEVRVRPSGIRCLEGNCFRPFRRRGRTAGFEQTQPCPLFMDGTLPARWPLRPFLPLLGHVVFGHEPSKCILQLRMSGDFVPDLVTTFPALPKPERNAAVYPPAVVHLCPCDDRLSHLSPCRERISVGMMV